MYHRRHLCHRTCNVQIQSKFNAHSLHDFITAGAMAEGGAAQVYITAGKPVNTEQVRNLVRECLAEKIRTMLETRETLDRTPEDVMAAAASKPIREGDQTSQPMRAQENQQEPDVRQREVCLLILLFWFSFIIVVHERDAFTCTCNSDYLMI